MFSNVVNWDRNYDFRLLRWGHIKLWFGNQFLQNGPHVLKQDDFTVGFHRIQDMVATIQTLRFQYNDSNPNRQHYGHEPEEDLLIQPGKARRGDW